MRPLSDKVAETLIGQMYSLELAMRMNTAAQRALLPQFFDAGALMSHYAAEWDQVKAMFEIRMGIKLGDRRTARARLDDVLRLDAMLRG